MSKTPYSDVLVEPMTLGDIRPLFPLMRAIEPSLQLSAWLNYARSVVKAKPSTRAGILIARRRPQAMPCGAACYRLDRDLRYGSVLTAEHVIALDLLYPQAVLMALFDALDGLALRLGCGAIRSIAHDRGPDILEPLRIAGHRREGTMLAKHYGPA